MYTIDVLLLVVKEAGENGLKGRTLLQKKVYFLSELMNIDLGFTAHYYGTLQWLSCWSSNKFSEPWIS